MIDSHADKYPNMALHLHSHPGQLTTQSGLVTHVITTHIVLTLSLFVGTYQAAKIPAKIPAKPPAKIPAKKTQGYPG